MPVGDPETGFFLLYPGLLHSVHGESESGKSWIIQAETVRLVKSGEKVLFLDFENDARTVVHRFMALGANKDDLSRIDYRNPDAGPDLTGMAWREMFNNKYAMAAIDGMTDALGLFKLGSKDNDEVAMFIRKFRQLGRRTGAAVVIIDHVAKDKNTRGRFAIGGQAKMAGLDGAAYVVDVVEPLARGKRGVLKVLVAKDKPGFVREHAHGFSSDRLGDVARFVLDSTTTPLTCELQPVGDPFTTPEFEEERKSEQTPHVRDEGLEILVLEELSRMAPAGATAADLAALMRKGKQRVVHALADLETEGHVVSTPGSGKAWNKKTFTITESGETQVA
jgi:hypothetical protein